MTQPIVVKLGGSSALRRDAVLADVAALGAEGRPVVVVHGGGRQIDRLMAELGRSPRQATFPGGRAGRLTDRRTLDALQMALAGRVKPRLVGALCSAGRRAVGLTGVDGSTVRARRKAALKVVEGDRRRIVRDDLSGSITDVDPTLLLTLLEAGCTPVLSPPVDGGVAGPLNVDADHVAAAVAVALGASALLFFLDVAGLLRDVDDPGSLVPRIATTDLSALAVSGRMQQKLRAAGDAADSGIPLVVLADGRRPHPVRSALEGDGTVVTPGRLRCRA